MRRHFLLAGAWVASAFCVTPLAPREAAAQQAAPSSRVELHVQSDQSDVQLFMRADQNNTGWSYRAGAIVPGRGGYAMVCTAPCDVELPTGLQRLALSHHGGQMIEADDPIDLRSPSTMSVHYDSHAAIRTIGYVVAIGSVIAGMVIIVASWDSICTQMQRTDGDCTAVNTTPLTTGLAVAIGGGIIGAILTAASDHATVELVPAMSSAALRLTGTSESVAIATPETPGLGLRVRF